MNEGAVRFLGFTLIFLGVFGVLYAFDLISPMATGFYSVAKFYPMSVASPEAKISSSLGEILETAPPDQNIPVVVVLTAQPGAMAIAQQQTFLQVMQIYGFQPTAFITHVDNAIAGYVPAGKVKQLASNPNVRAVLYDKKIARLFELKVKLLKDSVPMIKAPEVWKEGYTGQGVVLVIVDSGVKDDHPWLIRNGKSLVIKEEVVVPGAADYTMWHGTHCASIVASQDATYHGVAPGIDGIVDIVAFDYHGSSTVSWLLAALDKAYKDAQEVKKSGKAVVFTNSWGTIACDHPEVNEIRYAALKLTELGPVVFAAGNFGPASSTIAAPADADNDKADIITVGAVCKDGEVADFSSRGPDEWGSDHDEPDIAAPGRDIVAADTSGLSRPASGTSMATPHVAGVVALMLSKNPSLTNNQALDILMKTAVDKGSSGFDYDYGAGIVDAHAAVSAVQAGLIPHIALPVTYIIGGLAMIALVAGFALVSNPRMVVS